MGIWLELGIFGLVFVFAFWQMHDVRQAQEQTRRQRAQEKARLDALTQAAASEHELPAPTAETPTANGAASAQTGPAPNRSV